MTHFRWAGGPSSDFSSFASWVNEDNGQTGAPGASDSVDLLGSGSITGTGTVATLTAFAGSSFNLSAHLTVATTSDDGRMILTGGALDAGMLTIDSAGQFAQGLMLLNGASLSTASATLGSQSASSGTLQMAGTTWADTGTVIVGDSGQGTLLIASSAAGYGSAHIGGALELGAGGGGGMLVLTSAGLTVGGTATLGRLAGAAASTLTIQAGSQWTSGGQAVVLDPGASANQVNTLSVIGTGTVFQAGLLSIGLNAVASIDKGGAATLGTAPAMMALGVAGALSVGVGARLGVTGSVMLTGGAGAAGLSINGGTATLSSSNVALSLSAGASFTITNSGILTATGGISAGSASIAMSAGGQLTATGTSLLPALTLSNGSTLMATGATLTVAAAGQPTPAGHIAASLAGGTAHLLNSLWNVNGDLLDGGAGSGMVTEQGSRVQVSGILRIGSGTASGIFVASPTDTVVCGAPLAMAANGISAAGIDLEGAGSVLTAGTLQIGAGQLHGSMTIGAGTATIGSGVNVNGTLTLAGGGTLRAASLAINGGSAIIGSGTLSAATISDQGRIGTNGGTLTVTGAITGAGQLSVRAGMLAIAGTEGASTGIVFGNAGTIVTPSVGDLAGTISGWQVGDVIDFTAVHAASFTYAAGKLSLFDAAHHLLGTETFAGNGLLAAHNFTLSADHATGTMLSFHV